MLHVTPDQNQPARQGWCLAELYKANGADRTLVWKRYLINNVAPAKALVADSGKYVVTLGDWGQFDTVPLVVYGEQGEVSEAPDFGYALFPYANCRRLHSRSGRDSMRALRVLRGGRQDIIHPPRWRSDVHALAGRWRTSPVAIGIVYATANHGMSPEDCDALEAFSRKRAAELAMEYLQSPDARLREIGAIVAGELHLREAIPQLQQLLQDKPQDLDPRRVNTRLPMGFAGLRVDPAQAAQHALREIAEDQEEREKGTLVPKDADDKSAWAQALDRGQQAKNAAPLESFLDRWQSERQAYRAGSAAVEARL